MTAWDPLSETSMQNDVQGSDSPSIQRRRLLGSLGAAATTVFTGCTGAFGPSGGSADEGKLALPSVVTRGSLPDGRVTLKPDGTVTLLNFFATWCKPCQKEMPDFQRLRDEYDSDTVHMVSITPEMDDRMIRTFWDSYDGTWTVVKDPELEATKKWGANSYPTNLLFAQDGAPVTGESPKVNAQSFTELKSLIDPLVREK